MFIEKICAIMDGNCEYHESVKTNKRQPARRKNNWNAHPLLPYQRMVVDPPTQNSNSFFPQNY
jgi:hypothetical protein